MRLLDAATLLAQKTGPLKPRIKVEFYNTSGTVVTTTLEIHDSDVLRALTHYEGEWDSNAKLVCNNLSGPSSFDYLGHRVDISWGVDVAGTPVYSKAAPLWVQQQYFDTSQAQSGLVFVAKGLGFLLSTDRASSDFILSANSSYRVGAALDPVFTGNLHNSTGGVNPLNHLENYTLDWDTWDPLCEDVIGLKVGEALRFKRNATRLSIVKGLVGLTQTRLRPENDGEWHTVLPCPDYELVEEWAATTTMYPTSDYSSTGDTPRPTRVRPTDAYIAANPSVDGYLWKCTTPAGSANSGGIEPAWVDHMTPGEAFSDGSTQWTVDIDAQFKLGSGNHPFYRGNMAEEFVVPNLINVITDEYEDAAEYTPHSAIRECQSFEYVPGLPNQLSCLRQANVRLENAMSGSHKGGMTVLMHAGLEVYDRVHLDDTGRTGQYGFGNVTWLERSWEQNTRRHSMRVGFGDDTSKRESTWARANAGEITDAALVEMITGNSERLVEQSIELLALAEWVKKLDGTVTGEAGETLTAGEWCYFKTSDEKWYKANAGATATSTDCAIGICTGALASGDSGEILLYGFTTLGLGAGLGTMYISTTDGEATITAPDSTGNVRRILGYRLPGGINYVCPEHDWVVVA